MDDAFIHLPLKGKFDDFQNHRDSWCAPPLLRPTSHSTDISPTNATVLSNPEMSLNWVERVCLGDVILGSVNGLKEFFARLADLTSGFIIGLFQGDCIQYLESDASFEESLGIGQGF